ncbi:MAG TPA: hypothetical protein V6D22_11750 [Candidatus Obscuribacterales bacterium]
MRLASRVAATLTLASLLAAPVIQQVSFAAETEGAAKGSLRLQENVLPVTKQQDLDIENKVDARLARLTIQTNNEKYTGRLSNEEAESFISALNQVAETEAEYLALEGKVPADAQLSMQLTLDHFEKSLNAMSHDRKVASLDMLGKELLMQHRIDAAESDGRLSKTDAEYLRARLSSIISEQSSRAASGKVHYGDALVTSLHLDTLASEFAHRLRKRPFAVPDVQTLSNEVEQLEKKESAEGMQRVRALSQLLNHPLPEHLEFKTSKALGSEAVLQKAAQLEWLKALLELDQSGKVVAVGAAQQESAIDHTLATLLDSGRLSPGEAQDLQSDLEAIKAHQPLGADGAQLSPDQQGQLALALARLQARIARTQHPPTIFWAGIDAMQASIDERVGDGVKAARLTPDQAKELKTDADKIAEGEATYRKQSGGLGGKDALVIAEQLEQLNVKLHQYLKDRVSEAPDLDMLQSALSKTISDSIEMGSLDYHSRLADKLNHIADLKQAYANAPGGLDNRAKLAVGQAIMHNIAELKGAVHHDETLPPQSLDMRLSGLTHDISASVASGVLDPERAAQYKAAVDTVYGELLNAHRNPAGMTPAESLAVANDIDSLRDQYDDEQRDAATLPMHLAPRIKELAGRIGRALADGRLSLSQASELISQLDRSAERLAQAASTQGGLSHGEGLMMAYHLELMNERMESALHDQPITIVQSQQKSEGLDRKLASALAAGRISVNQAQQLHSRYQAVAADADAFQKSDHYLSYPEQLALGLEWDHLSAAVDKSASPGNKFMDLSTRRMALEKRIKEAVAAGRLNAKEGQLLTEDLDRTAQSEASFRMSDERLDYAEALTLALELDRVSTKMDRLLKGQLSLQQKH